MVSILPVEYDMISEVEESEEDYNPEDMEKYKSMCCYVTYYGYGNQQKAIFEKPNGSMKSHLKPLFLQAKVDDTRVNKVLVDRDAAVNLMPRSLLKKIGKCVKVRKTTRRGGVELCFRKLLPYVLKNCFQVQSLK